MTITLTRADCEAAACPEGLALARLDTYSTYWRRYERRLIIDALLLCTRSDMPAAVDEMVRARMLSRDGADALTTAAAVREFAAILATWVEQGCP